MKTKIIFYALLFISFKVLLTQDNEVFLPLRNFEHKTSFAPDLVSFPKNIPDNYIPKVEYIELERLFFISYGCSIILFKSDNSNYFSIFSEGYTNLSFSLIHGRDELLVIGKNPITKMTSIFIYNWRLRKLLKEVIRLGISLNDVIHITGTNIGLVYNEHEAFIVDLKEGNIESLENFKKGAKKCLYIGNNESPILCQFENYIEKCIFGKKLMNCNRKLFNYPILNFFNMFWDEMFLVTFTNSTQRNQAFRLSNLETIAPINIFIERSHTLIWAIAYTSLDKILIIYITFNQFYVNIYINEDSLEKKVLFFLELDDIFRFQLKPKGVERTYGVFNYNNDVKCIAKIEEYAKNCLIISNDYKFKSFNNRDFVISKIPYGNKFYFKDMNAAGTEKIVFTISRELDAYDFLDDKIILLTSLGFEIYEPSTQSFIYRNYSLYSRNLKLLGLISFTSINGYQMVLIVYQTALKLISIAQGKEVLSYPTYLEDQEKIYLNFFECPDSIKSNLAFNGILIIISKAKVFIFWVKTSIEYIDKFLEKPIDGYQFFDFLEYGVAIGFKQKVLLINFTCSNYQETEFTLPYPISSEDLCKYDYPYIICYKKHIKYRFTNILDEQSPCSEGFNSVQGYCVPSCDNEKGNYLNLSTGKCDNTCSSGNVSCILKPNFFLNQTISTIKYPKNCIAWIQTKGCLICDFGYYKMMDKYNSNCYPCSEKYYSCIECTINFCSKYKEKPIEPILMFCLILLIGLFLLIFKLRGKIQNDEILDNTVYRNRLNDEGIPFKKVEDIPEYQELIRRNESLKAYDIQQIEAAINNKELIAEGASAFVYRIKYNNSFYAMKTPKNLCNYDDINACLNEIDIALHVQSNFVVRVYWLYARNIIPNNNELYIIMQDCNCTLEDFITTRYYLTNAQKKIIFKRLFHGIYHFQNNHRDYHIFHGDIKPKNILVELDSEGRSFHQVYFADFGIALKLPKSTKFQRDIQSMTLNYAAPEQINHDTLSHNSDIYSLGLIMLELYTRKLTPSEKKYLKLNQNGFEAFWRNFVLVRQEYQELEAVFRIIQKMLTFYWVYRPGAEDLLSEIESL